MFNRQEAFNTSVRGLRAQGFVPSINSTDAIKQPVFAMSNPDLKETCAYRGLEGRKCAIGHLITDEYYSLDLEGRSVGYHTVLGAVASSMNIDEFDIYQYENTAFLDELQKCHDRPYFDAKEHKHDLADVPNLIEVNLRKFATKYGLDYPEI